MKTIVDFTNKIKEKFSMRKDIAPVESSSTASRAYSAGDNFYYGNLLQKATTDIAQGAALVGGTNFENADPVTEQVTSLKETFTNNVNQNGCKNRLDFTSWYNGTNVNSQNGVTGTITENGTTFTGTSSAATYLTSKRMILQAGSYVLSAEGFLTSGLTAVLLFNANTSANICRLEKSNNEDNKAFTLLEDTECRCEYIANTSGLTVSGTVKTMVSLATDYAIDTTWQPPTMTNNQLTTDKVGMDLLSEVGAVNYLRNDASSQTVENVNYQVNGDKSITVSANGTSNTNNSNLVLSNHGFYLKAGTYKLSCEGLPANKGYLRLSDPFTEGSFPTVESEDNDIVFTVSSAQESTAVYIFLRIAAKKAISATLYPMISPVSYKGPYVTYAKTNKELTDIVDPLKTQFDEDHNTVVTTNAVMNVFFTDNALPSDWTNLTTQQATDIAQGLYDFFKKIGGRAWIRYSGIIVIYYKKASDGSQLGYSSGMVDAYSNAHYSTILSDNTKARFVLDGLSYGETGRTQYALWGNKLMISHHGINNAGTVFDYDKRYTYNTISTYKG